VLKSRGNKNESANLVSGCGDCYRLPGGGLVQTHHLDEQTRHLDQRINDLRSEMSHRFDDPKGWIRALWP
jgi:hypothetical protein